MELSSFVSWIEIAMMNCRIKRRSLKQWQKKHHFRFMPHFIEENPISGYMLSIINLT